MVKREYTDEEEEVKETYIWLSCTLAVVTSAQLAVYKMACRVVDVIDVEFISKDPSFFVWLYPSTLHLYMPERGGTATPLLIDDLCHRWPFAFRRKLSIAVIEWSSTTTISLTNRYPPLLISFFYICRNDIASYQTYVYMEWIITHRLMLVRLYWQSVFKNV